MTLNRWDPLRDLLNFHDKMNRLMDAACDPRRIERVRAHWVPVVDVLETADSYIFCADLPGVGRDNISIEVRSGMLVIQGERAPESQPTPAAHHSVERKTGIFQRAVPIPGRVNVDAAEARYTDGVLEVRLPKSHESSPRMVEVIRLG